MKKKTIRTRLGDDCEIEIISGAESVRDSLADFEGKEIIVTIEEANGEEIP